MRLHPRSDATSKARVELGEAVCRIVEKHGLTCVETVAVLATVGQSWATFALRDERHDSDVCDRRADEECENPACLATSAAGSDGSNP